MKKFMLALSAIALAATFTGCATSKTAPASNKDLQQQKEEQTQAAKDEYDQFIEDSRAAEEIEKTGVEAVDLIADASTEIYKKVGGAMRERIELLKGDVNVATIGRVAKDYFEAIEPDDFDYIDGSCAGCPCIKLGAERVDMLVELKKAIEAQMRNFTETQKDGKDAHTYYELAYGVWAMEYYKEVYGQIKDGKLKLEDLNEQQKAIYEQGKDALVEKFAKVNLDESDSFLETLLDNANKLADRIALVTKDLAERSAVIVEGQKGLANDPACKDYVIELAKIKAPFPKRSAEQKAAAIEALNAKYPAAYEKISGLEKQLDEISKASAVLAGGVATQTKFTVVAIPWLIQSNKDMREMGGK